MVDHATNKQTEKDLATAAKKRHEARNRNDIVGKTTLDLPSLSGLEPMPLFPPKQATTPATSPDEATPPLAVSPMEVQAPTPAESLVDASSQPSLPLPPTTEARLRAIPARPVPNQSQQTTPLSLQEITGQTTSHPLKRIRLRPLFKSLKAGLVLALLCIIVVGGASAYFHFPSSAPQSTSSITIHQRASPPHIQQHSEATPESNSITVGDHPIIELQGRIGNVSIAAGKAGSLVIKTSSDQIANADANNLLHYTQSHDEQGHDLVRIINQAANQNVNYEILSPRATKVRITIDSGSIAIDGISGVTVTTINSSISVQDVTGPTSISTQNGDIALNNVKGAMVIQTNSGSIRGSTIDGQLKAITQNGDILIQHGALHDQSLLQTRQGSITYTGTIAPKSDYKINTQSGNVTLTLPAITVMQLHASIQSGTMSNAFRDTNAIPHAQVFIDVGTGSITIKKAT
ncbi:hypothetical protein KSF_054040 [Reticulibacter mediterranei]|uniref:DUF4097 domain-containing protein n=1 Tax=Reticulibacter mediterranei TaxID=2778369 RepID=A0A8J3ISC5_9CHLR|nr:DUF4097 family beta strand repeat-containing protein [Reticulibacter mediterranei]GHO95356.1 hypothetical protein KSF_054040 [Reticulibacter mediterranei]